MSEEKNREKESYKPVRDEGGDSIVELQRRNAELRRRNEQLERELAELRKRIDDGSRRR
jgi:cell division protein FtsB